MRIKPIAAIAGIALVGSLAGPAGSVAAGTGDRKAPKKADVIVTIKANGGDYSGVVKSSKPKKCANNRTVWLMKQKGNKQKPKQDYKFASDTSSLNGAKYEWNTGNTASYGKFYAMIKASPKCKKAFSQTIKTTQPPF